MSESIMSQRKDSEQSKVSQEGQIQPFEIEPKALTSAHLQLMIDRWGVIERIRQKFTSWQFHFTLQKVINIAPETFYRAAIHYVVLKKMQVLIKDFNENDLLMKSMELKQIYQLQSLKGKLKGQRFDYLLMVTVKLISFFLGSHMKEIIISNELEAKIYAILVFVLLGTQVGEKAYFVLIEKYKKKSSLKHNRSQQKIKDLILPTIAQTKKISEHNHKPSKTAIHHRTTLNRIQYRYGTQILSNPPRSLEDYKYRQIKQLLGANLQVKQFIPKPKVKQSLDAVLGKAVDVGTKLGELDVAKEMESKEMKHKKIGYAQMSSSMDLRGDNHALNILQNHTLNIKPEKLARFYQMKKKQDILLQSSKSSPNLNSLHLPKIQQPQPPEVYSYQAMVLKKKQPTYWKKILTQMKQNHEDVQHLPPVNMRLHFKEWELEDENKKETLVQDDVDKEEESLHHDLKDSGYHGEYITERVVDLLTVGSAGSDHQISTTSHQQAHSNKMVKSKKQLGHKRGLPSGKIMTEEVKQEPKKQQITVTEYSGIGNDGEMFKADRGFLHIYSSKPINDFDVKKKKKTYAEIKQLERKFYRDMKIRQEKILQSQFS